MRIVMIMAGMLLVASNILAKTPDEYLAEAGALEAGGDLAGASAALEPALAEHPDNAMILSKAGIYLAMRSGQGAKQKDIISFVTRSFDLLNLSVELEPENPMVRFQRGVVYVSVPDFLNKQETGIEDLQYVVSLAEKGAAPPELMIGALFNLGMGYRAVGLNAEARATWSQVVEMAQGSPIALQAEEMMSGLDDSPRPGGKTARQMLAEIPDIAELNRKLESDPKKPELLEALLEAIGREAEVYDSRTYIDTSFRTLLSLEAGAVADRLIAVSDDPRVRLDCAEIYVTMPFFLNRLDRGIAELQALTAGDAPDEIRAEAAYLLGCAWQRKATTAWIDAVTLYPRTGSADRALAAMHPRTVMENTSAGSGQPAVAVNFDLGFRDELAPQTAVWIENARGEFVRTLYVSGFCGFAREKQVDLPRWSQASDYADADAVTAASIDCGEHMYTWDCRDIAGKPVPAGDYTVKLECSWWPSMQYERAEAKVTVGDAVDISTAEPGRYIPYLGVRFAPGH